jgi:hypothetical protein
MQREETLSGKTSHLAREKGKNKYKLHKVDPIVVADCGEDARTI